MRRRGFAMATVLMVVFLLLLFALTLADLATAQYRLSWEASEKARACETAQAGVSDAIDRLTQNPNWTSPVNGTTDSDCTYQVQIVNNLQGATALSGVPPYTAQIVSSGWVASGKVDKITTLVQFASFPYAVAGSTGVQTGTMTVLGAPDLNGLVAGNLSLTGNVYSGGSGASSLSAGAGTSITGKARSVGGVQLGSPSTVSQGIEENVAPETLPSLDISSFNTSTAPDVLVMNPGIPYIAPLLTGPVFINGDVTLVSPVLLNAQLFVNGNLNIAVQL